MHAHVYTFAQIREAQKRRYKNLIAAWPPDACSVSGSGCGVISSRVRELRLVRVDHYLTERRARRRRKEKEDEGLPVSIRFFTACPASRILRNTIPGFPPQGQGSQVHVCKASTSPLDPEDSIGATSCSARGSSAPGPGLYQ